MTEINIKNPHLIKEKLAEFVGKNKSYIAAFALFFIFWSAFLGFSGTITSGFHFTDDHEIVAIKDDLKAQNVMQVSKKWIAEDLQRGRLRIVYYFHRVVEVKIFGSNFVALSVYTACLAIATSFFLFYFLSLLGFSFWESVLFSLISLTGAQMTIWWRLGPAETLGIFLLAASLFFLSLHIKANKHKKIYSIIFVTMAVLSALTKESFILILPMCMLLLIYLSHVKNDLTWKDSIKKNATRIIVLAVAFLMLVSYIKFFLGTGGVGYAGIDKLNPRFYFKIFWDLSKNGWLGTFILVQAAVVAFFVFLGKNCKENGQQMLKRFAFPVLIFLAIVIPQVVLYAKSGFLNRYMVPVIFGYALAFAYLLKQIRKKSAILWFGMILVTLFFISGDVKNNFKDAQVFAQSGRETNNLFIAIEKNTYPNANFLIVGDPIANYEAASSMRKYLTYELGRKNLFIYALSKKVSYLGFNDQLMKGFGMDYEQNRYENISDKKIIDAIILFPKMERIFLENYSDLDLLKTGNMTREEVGSYVIYYKSK